MIPRELLPTVLIPPAERPPVARAEGLGTPPRWRTPYVLWHLLRTAGAVLWSYVRLRLTPAECGHLVRGCLERMGTVWIKAGQILSLRCDLFPAEFCIQLAELRDRGVGFPFEVARRIAEDELGGPLEAYFDEFTETPFAATTIAQLHRARLRSENVWVAVKIQQPYASQAFARDFQLIQLLTTALSRLNIPRNLEWSGLLRELRETMTRELDFAYEASSLRRLRKTLRRHGVYVPTVFTQYSGARVLVMEYIQAALMSDFIDLHRRDPVRLSRWLEENNIDPRRVAKRLFHSVFRQILEDNLFHGDLHPHNLILLRNSRLAVIDCRSVGSLEVENLTKHRLYLRAIADGEYATAADIQFLLSSRLPLVDLPAVKDELVRVWRVWSSRTFIRALPYEDKSLTAMFDDVNRVVIKHRFAVQWSMTRLARSFANLDVSLRHLHPRLNCVDWLRTYFSRMGQRGRTAGSRALPSRIDRAVVAVAHLPRMMSESSIFQQTIVRRQAQVIQGSTTKAGELLAGVCGYVALLLILLDGLFLCALLAQHQDVAIERFLGRQLAGIVGSLPRLDAWVWLGIVGVVFLAQRTTTRWGARFIRKPVRVPEVAPSV